MVHLLVHLIMSANTEDKSWKGVPVKRGQLITSRQSLSENTGISERTVRTSLKRLKSTNEVTIKTTKRYSVITICNYDDYQAYANQSDQANNQVSDQQVTNSRPTSDQQVTTTKEYKNTRSNKYINNTTFSIPTVNEVLNYAHSPNCGFAMTTEQAEKFIAHYDSLGWKKQGGFITDWKPLVILWKNNQSNFKQNRNTSYGNDDGFDINDPSTFLNDSEEQSNG
jgi:predicted transcriptional regulator